MSKFLSMEFFRCIAWAVAGSYALDIGFEIKSISLIILGAFSVSLAVVLFTVFDENRKEEEKKCQKVLMLKK